MLEAFRHTVLKTIGPARKIEYPVGLRLRVRIRVITKLSVSVVRYWFQCRDKEGSGSEVWDSLAGGKSS